MRPILQKGENRLKTNKKSCKKEKPRPSVKAFSKVKKYPVLRGIDKKALRHRQKIFTTNNHYEWSKIPVVPQMPDL
jgi:hypothetical protein